MAAHRQDIADIERGNYKPVLQRGLDKLTELRNDYGGIAQRRPEIIRHTDDNCDVANVYLCPGEAVCGAAARAERDDEEHFTEKGGDEQC